MTRIAIASLLVLTLAVSACGRKGALQPPPAPPAQETPAG